MKDTAFEVPASKLDRLLPATMAGDPFHPDRAGSSPYDPVDGQWARPPAFPSAAAGLVSTADEQKAISEMVPPGYRKDHGWGFGMAVVTGPDELAGRAGRYGWDGGLGTSWCTDPTQDLVGVLMTQRAAFPAMSGVYRAFWRAVYGG